MARYTYDDASVGNGLDALAKAKSALYNTESDISKALQTINSAGKGYIEYSVADAAGIVGNDLDSIDSITKEIASTAADLAYYFDHPIQSAIGNLFGTIDMALFNLLEGAGSGIEGIFDGILTIAGWGSGLVGWDGAQDFLSGVIEKDYVGDFFDYQYESGALKSVEFYSAYSHDSGVAEVIKGFGTAAAYVGIGIATSGALAADIGFTYLGEQGRKTQTSLQSGKSFDEAAKDGFKAGLLGAAAAGAGNLAGGLLGKQFGKVVDKFHPTPSNATSAIASSADDVAKAGTKIDDALGAASKVDDVAGAASKVDDVTSTASKVEKGQSKSLRERANSVSKLDDSVDSLSTPKATEKAGPLRNKADMVSRLDESAEGATKTATENSGKAKLFVENENDLPIMKDHEGASGSTDKLSELAKDGPIMKDHEGASSVGEAINNNAKSNASSLTEKANSVSKLDDSVDSLSTPKATEKAGPLRNKADMVSRLDESAEGATKAATENSGKYNLEEVAKDGPIMKDYEGASGSTDKLSELAKEGPIMKDHEGASSTIKATDNQPDINTPMDAEYTVLEHPANAAKADDLASAGAENSGKAKLFVENENDLPIMKDHEGASSTIKATDNQPDINTPMDAEYTVLEHPANAAKADDLASAGAENSGKAKLFVENENDLPIMKDHEGASGSTDKLSELAKDGPIMKDHEGASSVIKAADNQPDINTPMDAEYTVLEHPANAAKADNLASAANKADINTPIDAEYTVLEPSINGRTIGNRIGTGTATGLNAARQNLSNNNIETLYANEPNSNDYRFDNLSNNGDTTSIENIGGTSSDASTPGVESPQVNSQPSPTGNNSTIPSSTSSAYSTYSTVGTTGNTGSSVQYRVETQSTPSSNTSITTPEINTPTQTVPDTGNNSTIPGSNTGNGESNSGSNTDTTVPGGSTSTPTVPETPSTNPGDGISGGITTPEEPVPGTPNPNPPTDNVGGNITDIADNITGGTGGSTTGNYNNYGSSYGNSIIGGLNNNGSQLGPEGELSYENKPDSGILDGNDSINTIDKGDSLDVISIDKDTSKNPSTSSGGSSVIPTVLGVGAAGAAGVAGIHYVQKKFGKDNEYYEDEEETDQENNDDKNTDNYNIIEPENDINDITSPSEIEIKPPKYKAGSVNQLKLDDGADIKINEDKSIIAPQNEELE